jgi:hypothetical protein
MFPVYAALSACLALRRRSSLSYTCGSIRGKPMYPIYAALLDCLPCMNADVLLPILGRSKSEEHPMYSIYVTLFKGPRARTGGSIHGGYAGTGWHGLAPCRAAGAAGRVQAQDDGSGDAQGGRATRREYRADSPALRGIRKAGGYAALACPLESSGRGCAQACAAAVYRFTVESERLKCSAVARMLALFSARHARTAAASCAGGLPRLSLPR